MVRPCCVDTSMGEERSRARSWDLWELCHGCCWGKFYLTCVGKRVPGGHSAVGRAPTEIELTKGNGVFCHVEEHSDKCWYYTTYKPLNRSGVYWRVMLKRTALQRHISRPKAGNPERCVRPEGLRIDGGLVRLL